MSNQTFINSEKLDDVLLQLATIAADLKSLRVALLGEEEDSSPGPVFERDRFEPGQIVQTTWFGSLEEYVYVAWAPDDGMHIVKAKDAPSSELRFFLEPSQIWQPS